MIVKFCKKVHNPLESKTKIQLRTLSFYKSVDNDFIRDIDEGSVSRTFHPDTPAVHTGDEIGKMTGLSVSGSGSIRFVGQAIKTTYQIPNAFIFCTSQLQDPTMAHTASLGYDSFYAVQNPQLFCEKVAQQVQSSILISSAVLAFHGPVIYRDEKVVQFSQFNAFHQSHRVINQYLYLLKRRTSREDPNKVFASDNEYRFVFIPVDKGRRPIQLTNEIFLFDAGIVMDVLGSVY